MTTINVTSEELASILILDKSLELIPEPFRCQSHVTIQVDFEEYATFCGMLGSYDGLTYSGAHMQRLVTAYRKGSDKAKIELWEAFLKDVAMGILKEVYWAEILGKEGTIITHIYNDTEVTLSEKEIDEYFANVRELVQPTVLDRFTSNSYNYPPKVTCSHNIALYKRAIVMYYLARAPFTWNMHY